MASGDVVVQVIRAMPPAASAPGPAIRAGGSTPGEVWEGWSYDAAADEYMDYLCLLNGYGGGGLTFVTPWSAASAITGNIRIGIAIRAFPDDTEDIDVSHTYDFNETTDAAPSASGEIVYPSTTFTDGVDMDSWANDQLAIVRIRREGTDATNDTMTGDAQFWDWYAVET